MTEAQAQTAPASPQIVARDLVKTYRMGDSIIGALQGINVDVAQGEYLAVTGHSGSGKSTFMNLVGALDTPTAGSLKIENRELSGLSSDALAQYRNEKIGFVFQTFNLLARTTALDNVALPLLYSHRHSKVDVREKARECLARAGQRPAHPARRRADRRARQPHHRRDHRPVRGSGCERHHGDPGNARARHCRACAPPHHFPRRVHGRGRAVSPFAAFRAAIVALRLNALRSFLA